MTIKSAAITINQLTKTYSNGTKALKGTDLIIMEGDFFALLGANGAGKTTIIGILTGIVNKTSGSVKVFDFDIDTQSNEARKMLGVVPQEFNFNQFEKVIDILIAQAGYYGIARKEAIIRADELLKVLGLDDKRDLVSRTLSGGMKRRLMIARALMHRPKVLILDEPTAGVDVELRHGMWDYLTKLNSEEGITILLTTHYLEEVEQLCKNAAIIKQGEIIKNDSVRNLLQSMDKETYIVDIKSGQVTTQIQSFETQIVDDNTLEITISKSQTLNELLQQLTSQDIIISGIRPKGNRLEELFLNLTQK